MKAQPSAIALDFGTTNIKAGILFDNGVLGSVKSLPAPPVTGNGLMRESDPSLYLETAIRMLHMLRAEVPKDTPLGIAAQRSSFLLWNRQSGQPLTKLLSWQDRRAASWCEAHTSSAGTIRAITGLVPSPHYVGPKLAYLCENNTKVAQGFKSGDMLWGTLETFLIWNLTHGEWYQTDLSMAGRSLMADIKTGSWSSDLLKLYHLDSVSMPEIRSTCEYTTLKGRKICFSSAADQAAAVMSILKPGDNAALVTMGTGLFVFRLLNQDCGIDTLLKQASENYAGYLLGPLPVQAGATPPCFCLEGSINTASDMPEHAGEMSPNHSRSDSSKDFFCIPDAAGIGAPHWKPEVSTVFSEDISGLSDLDTLQLMHEGMVFRIREIMEDIFDGTIPETVYITGGRTTNRYLCEALAACLGKPVHRIASNDAALTGVACLAAGRTSSYSASTEIVQNPPHLAYFFEKYHRWKEWLTSIVS